MASYDEVIHKIAEEKDKYMKVRGLMDNDARCVAHMHILGLKQATRWAFELQFTDIDADVDALCKYKGGILDGIVAES